MSRRLNVSTTRLLNRKFTPIPNTRPHASITHRPPAAGAPRGAEREAGRHARALHHRQGHRRAGAPHAGVVCPPRLQHVRLRLQVRGYVRLCVRPASAYLPSVYYVSMYYLPSWLDPKSTLLTLPIATPPDDVLTDDGEDHWHTLRPIVPVGWGEQDIYFVRYPSGYKWPIGQSIVKGDSMVVIFRGSMFPGCWVSVGAMSPSNVSFKVWEWDDMYRMYTLTPAISQSGFRIPCVCVYRSPTSSSPLLTGRQPKRWASLAGTFCPSFMHANKASSFPSSHRPRNNNSTTACTGGSSTLQRSSSRSLRMRWVEDPARGRTKGQAPATATTQSIMLIQQRAHFTYTRWTCTGSGPSLSRAIP
jgi:hypothetical protein